MHSSFSQEHSGVIHGEGQLQKVKVEKTACEPAQPTPSTHASVQTLKFPPPAAIPLTNFSCQSQTGKDLHVQVMRIAMQDESV